MKRHLAALAVVLAFLAAAPARAQEEVPPVEFHRAEVVETYAMTASQQGPKPFTWLRFRVLDGPDRFAIESLELHPTSVFALGNERALRVGERIIVGVVRQEDGPAYFVADQERERAMLAAAGLFILLVVAVGRKKGAFALLGLAGSATLLLGVALPRIVAGDPPLPILAAAAAVFATASVYLGHGLKARTHVAVGAIALSVVLAAAASWALAAGLKLFGLGGDEAALLQATPLGGIDFRGLLLGGMILGAVGVLDDVTTTQAAAVEELSIADPSLDRRALYLRGLSVGREHVASLINTLFLAYAGVSFPLFLLYRANGGQPLWVFLNGEFVAEEVARTLSGSAALVLAVPIATALAAWRFGRGK